MRKTKHAYHDHNIKRKYSHVRRMTPRLNYFLILSPLILVCLVFFVSYRFDYFQMFTLDGTSWSTVVWATLLTCTRVMVAYFISLFIAFLLATLVTSSQSVENILLPIFDVIESVPILAFFPIIITFFIDLGYVEGASLFILIMTMMWSILFTVVSGIKLIPEDIQDAAKVFGIKKWEYYRHVLFPGVFPEMVTGSILAFASAWDVTVVAEVLHIYMRNDSMSDDLLGLGSLLVNSNASGNTQVFTISLIIMILLIALVNILVWQRLLRYSEKYKFE